MSTGLSDHGAGQAVQDRWNTQAGKPAWWYSTARAPWHVFGGLRRKTGLSRFLAYRPGSYRLSQEPPGLLAKHAMPRKLRSWCA